MATIEELAEELKKTVDPRKSLRLAKEIRRLATLEKKGQENSSTQSSR